MITRATNLSRHLLPSACLVILLAAPPKIYLLVPRSNQYNIKTSHSPPRLWTTSTRSIPMQNTLSLSTGMRTTRMCPKTEGELARCISDADADETGPGTHICDLRCPATPILDLLCGFVYDTSACYIIFVPLQDCKNMIGLGPRFAIGREYLLE